MLRVEERIHGRKAKQIYEAVRRRGTASKAELLAETGMPSSTLTRLLEELTEQRWLIETGFGESTGGRRPILYGTNPDYAYAIGLDISRVKSTLVLTNLHGRVLDSRAWSMGAAMGPDQLLGEAVKAGISMLEEKRIPREKLIGMGIGAVGPVDFARGMILEPKYFAHPGWSNVPVRKQLEELLGVPVLLDNGANAALLGEYWRDPSPVKKKHQLYVHVGAGLRSAMMTGGSIVYGAVDMEGAVGQMIIEMEGRAPREEGGNRGALESYLSLSVLEREFGSPELWDLLDQGDTRAIAVLEKAAATFGIGLANLLNILHPEKVILGGPTVQAHPVFFQSAVQAALERTYYYPAAYQVEFSRGLLGETAIAVGAAVLAVNRLSADPIQTENSNA